jgi:hypothetical protein
MKNLAPNVVGKVGTRKSGVTSAVVKDVPDATTWATSTTWSALHVEGGERSRFR